LLGYNLDGNQIAWKLVMDEPANDLDIETLELLESLLVDYQGTVLLVSHDRAFLNDVVTSTLVIEVDGLVKEHEAGYQDRDEIAGAKKRLEDLERDLAAAYARWHALEELAG